MKNPESIPLFLNTPQKLTGTKSKLPIEGTEISTVYREQIRETEREQGTIQTSPCPCGIHILVQEASNDQRTTQTHNYMLRYVLERKGGDQSTQ